MGRKNTISLSLILCSVGLLIVLQVLWLKNSYENAFHDFNRESNYIFRTTILGLRDSLLEHNIEPVSNDSVEMWHERAIGDSAEAGFRHSDISYVNVEEKGEKIQIYISATGQDSLKGLIRPLAAKVRGVKGRRNFIIRISPDTINVDTISLHYRRALLKANLIQDFTVTHLMTEDFNQSIDRIPIPGRLDRIENPKKLSVLKDTIVTEAVHINPAHKYEASFPGIRFVLIRNILPQILFSFFLTLITTTSFIIIFRGLRAQQRLMEAKNDFISNVTHELKTPVATVSVALEALRNFQAKGNPKLTEEYLDIAQREINRLSEMTDKILRTTIFESKGVEFIPETVDLDAVIRQMMDSLKVIFENRGATVTYEKHGENFELQGSEVHLTSLIYNLIDNALKYSPGNPVIHIQLTNSVPLLALSVKDNGIGILKEYQTNIFEKFYRIPSGDVHNTKGYGLGLSYVASVVKSHYGTIDVFSEPGKGSEFRITLPRPPVRFFRKTIKI